MQKTTSGKAGKLNKVQAILKMSHLEMENVLDMKDKQHPEFTLAKNKARFLRMLTWYRAKDSWLSVAPLSATVKLCCQQEKELNTIRKARVEYEMDLEMGNLTTSQKAYRFDELTMCRIHEKMAVFLVSKMKKKIKLGRC